MPDRLRFTRQLASPEIGSGAVTGLPYRGSSRRNSDRGTDGVVPSRHHHPQRLAERVGCGAVCVRPIAARMCCMEFDELRVHCAIWQSPAHEASHQRGRASSCRIRPRGLGLRRCSGDRAAADADMAPDTLRQLAANGHIWRGELRCVVCCLHRLLAHPKFRERGLTRLRNRSSRCRRAVRRACQSTSCDPRTRDIRRW